MSKGRFFVGKSRVLVDKGRFFAGEGRSPNPKTPKTVVSSPEPSNNGPNPKKWSELEKGSSNPKIIVRILKYLSECCQGSKP